MKPTLPLLAAGTALALAALAPGFVARGPDAVAALPQATEAAPTHASDGLLSGLLVPAAVAQTRTPSAATATLAVPDALRGAWYQGECNAPSVTLQLTARAAARLPTDGGARLIRFAETRAVENWTMGIGRGAEAPRILLRGTATALETVEPDAKLRDDRLPGATPVQSWRRCPAAPASVAALHGEGVAFLAALEGLEAACGTGSPAPETCVAAVMREGDISGDGKLSVAEIARMVRGATWLLAIADEAAPEAVLATAGGGMLGGVAVARLMMESLDYDGDGKLSSAELGQDRLAFGRATGTAAGRPLRMEGLQEGVALLRGVMEGLMLDQQR